MGHNSLLNLHVDMSQDKETQSLETGIHTIMKDIIQILKCIKPGFTQVESSLEPGKRPWIYKEK